MQHPIAARVFAPALVALSAAGSVACQGAVDEPGQGSESGASTTDAPTQPPGSEPTSTGADTTGADTTAGASTTATPGSSSGSASTGEAACDAERIELPGDEFYPEGVASDLEGNLYVTSLATGALVKADSCTGEVTELVAAESLLLNAVGLVVDEANGALLVCNSDLDFAQAPSLDVIDRDSGELLARHEFDGGLCNDVILDGAGNALVTDSVGGRIMTVPAGDILSDTPVRVWASDPDFEVEAGQFGLNGIAFDGDAAILVVNFAQGELHRVDIEADGSAGAITAIAVAPPGLTQPDGIEVLEGGDLLVVEAGPRIVSRVVFDGDAATVSAISGEYSGPTTAALIGADAWVAEGQFDHLFGMDPAPPDLPFLVHRLGL